MKKNLSNGKYRRNIFHATHEKFSSIFPVLLRFFFNNRIVSYIWANIRQISHFLKMNIFPYFEKNFWIFEFFFEYLNILNFLMNILNVQYRRDGWEKSDKHNLTLKYCWCHCSLWQSVNSRGTNRATGLVSCSWTVR